jgi:hypothetical protein
VVSLKHLLLCAARIEVVQAKAAHQARLLCVFVFHAHAPPPSLPVVGGERSQPRLPLLSLVKAEAYLVLCPLLQGVQPWSVLTLNQNPIPLALHPPVLLCALVQRFMPRNLRECVGKAPLSPMSNALLICISRPVAARAKRAKRTEGIEGVGNGGLGAIGRRCTPQSPCLKVWSLNHAWHVVWVSCQTQGSEGGTGSRLSSSQHSSPRPLPRRGLGKRQGQGLRQGLRKGIGGGTEEPVLVFVE